MKIVICDDCIEDLVIIKNLLLTYKRIYPKVEFEMEKFSDAAKLFAKIQRRELADIYILDMIMSEKSGIDIGNQIRKAGNDIIIIYITSSEDYAMEAYGVHAVRYLLKPVKKEKFFEAMDYALSYMSRKTEPVYLLKTKEGFMSIPYSRIEYIENASRHLEVSLMSGERVKSIFIRRSFDEEIQEILNNGGFIQVHKSFIINLSYVKKLTMNSVIMENGRNIPVSRARALGVRKEYLLYVSEEYR